MHYIATHITVQPNIVHDIAIHHNITREHDAQHSNTRYTMQTIQYTLQQFIAAINSDSEFG